MVLTKDQRLRVMYRGLGISPGKSMGSVLLRTVVPASRLGRWHRSVFSARIRTSPRAGRPCSYQALVQPGTYAGIDRQWTR